MALEAYTTELISSLSKVGLAPGSTPLIPANFKATTKLSLKYGEREVSLGNFFKTGETASAPSISFESEAQVCDNLWISPFQTQVADTAASSSNCNEESNHTALFLTPSSSQGGSENYILLFTDPDAPTPEDPKFAYWRHWVVPGLKPSSSGAATSSKAALTEYLGPGGKEAELVDPPYVTLSQDNCTCFS